MPEVIINLAEGRTLEQKRALLLALTDAVVKTCNVDPSAVVVSIMETPKHHKAKGGVPFNER